MRGRPVRRVAAVVYGIRITSSESLPLAVCPFGARTPVTLKRSAATWISWPTGSLSAKMRCATVRPSTATLRAARTSSGPKNAPASVCQSRIVW